MNQHLDNGKYRLAGYSYLASQLDLTAVPHFHISEVGGSQRQKAVEPDGRIRERYPKDYWPGDELENHFEFALKYEGVNPEIFLRVFEKVDSAKLASWIGAKPLGQYVRKVWYLYEWMTGRRLPVEDLTKGNYIDLLNENDYYTCRGEMVRRQRIRDNMLGNAQFSPLVRRTEALGGLESENLVNRCRAILSEYPEQLIKRAVSYLYTKETKSSYAIEHLTPTASRAERFSLLLQSAEKDDFVNKEALVALQNRIVDSRFAESDYRRNQNYVGETVAWQQEKVHYIPPAPEDLPGLMDGLTAADRKMSASELQPCVQAAVTSFGFVFMHPFEDGNGRIHRFLIHNILARRGFSIAGLIFPVSAAMLNDINAYDTALESFSKPLMTLMDYSLDERGRIEVHNQSPVFYRYPDMTFVAEALFRFVKITIEQEMTRELDFIRDYDKTKTAIQSIIDLPDRQIDLFIRFCLQNNGALSQNKRKSHFTELTDVEIEMMQKAICEAYRKTAGKSLL